MNVNFTCLYTAILEVNLFVFAYNLFHEDFSPLDGGCLYIVPPDTNEFIHLAMSIISWTAFIMKSTLMALL